MQATAAALGVDASSTGEGNGGGLGELRLSSALQALCLVARLHQVAAEPAALKHQLGLGASSPVSLQDMLRAARLLGLRPKHVRTALDRLPLTPLPALALMKGGAVAVLAQCDGQRVLLQRFGNEGEPPTPPLIEPIEQFAEQWTGELVLIASRASLAGDLRRFDFSWLSTAACCWKCWACRCCCNFSRWCRRCSSRW
jgi:ATP-binding cassette, subfamily B, bacterial HlyB/CyaB